MYGNLQFLTDSQASDERLWAGLGLGHFWNYIKYRWNIDGQSSVDPYQRRNDSVWYPLKIVRQYSSGI